jgi:hypothetical protein
VRKLFCRSFLLVSLACASCGHKTNGLYPVSGQVTFQGSPASGAAVFFHRQGLDPIKQQKEQMIMGIVREDGSFEVVSGSMGKGAPPGEYDVAIEWKEIPGSKKRRSRGRPDKLNGRYADPRKPRFHATVKEESNHLAPFDLTEG